MARLFYVAGLLMLLAARAHAQAIVAPAESKPGGPSDLSISSFDPADAVAPISIVEGPGVKVGEGTVIHPIVGLETGYDSNVFFQANNPHGTGLLRVVGQLETASLSRARLDANLPEDSTQTNSDSGDFEYMASVRLAYDQMLSGSEVVRDTGGLGAGAQLRGIVMPTGKLSFAFDESFVREIRAANFETSTNNNRDTNSLRLQLMLHPPGTTLTGYIYDYSLIDVFEQSAATQLYPDRFQNQLGVRVLWRLLPETVVFADTSESVVTGIGSSQGSENKATSYPFQVRAGVTTLLGLSTSVLAQAGYTNGFYTSGPSFSAPEADLEINHTYSPLGRIGASYDLTYTDSINANFYRDHAIRAYLMQAFVPFVVLVQPEIHFRQYDGVSIPGTSVDRNDVIFAIRGGIHYTYREWLAFVVDYKFSLVSTDFRYNDGSGEPIDPGYSRHELLAGVRAAF